MPSAPSRLLDRVGRGVAAAEAGRLVGPRRREGAHPRLRGEAALPGDVGRPGGLRPRGVVLDRLDEAADGLDVDVVEPAAGGGGHRVLLGQG
ncbi:hypothetical protein [Nocardioides convexus]|uniref:hypothetical protein n=1 Tax=Nocardioides convexus TaxID=2712224 RepID=UPI0024185AC5|nr:hypothetical protein [Nocardioides convexus]